MLLVIGQNLVENPFVGQFKTLNILITHPRVADAAVIGVPNEDFGEEVKACGHADASRLLRDPRCRCSILIAASTATAAASFA